MARYRVTCTTKHEKHEHITDLGCVTNTNLYQRFTEEEVIVRLEKSGDHDTFYVERPSGHSVEVEVATRDGKKYLKTDADGEIPNNLLSLPDCPAKKSDNSGTIRMVTAAGSHSVPFARYWGA